jgi:hypothetical protein
MVFLAWRSWMAFMGLRGPDTSFSPNLGSVCL